MSIYRHIKSARIMVPIDVAMHAVAIQVSCLRKNTGYCYPKAYRKLCRRTPHPNTDNDTVANSPIRIISVVIETAISGVIGARKSTSNLSPTGKSFFKKIVSIRMNDALDKLQRSTLGRLPSMVSLHYDPRGSRGSRAARLKVRSGIVEGVVWLVLFAV